jgi:hypothetical protein
MSDLDHILTQIAKEHLGIATLQARNNDSLDFYDVAVWQVRKALKDAYDAGRAASLLDDRPLLTGKA